MDIFGTHSTELGSFKVRLIGSVVFVKYRGGQNRRACCNMRKPYKRPVIPRKMAAHRAAIFRGDPSQFAGKTDRYASVLTGSQ